MSKKIHVEHADKVVGAAKIIADFLPRSKKMSKLPLPPLKKILIGSSDFSKLIQNDLYFVDKSLLIKEFIDGGDEVTLVTRPRRWGKSMNLAMLEDFFNIGDGDNGISEQELFKNLKIAQETIQEDPTQTYVDKYQGKSPVIILSLKDVGKADNFQEVKENFLITISKCCERLKENNSVSNYLLKNKEEKLVQDFNKLLCEEADDALLKKALERLSSLLYKIYANKKVYIFIDEYDNPLNKAFGTSYFDELAEFMKTFLGAGLKDNHCLEKAFVTGVLRISQSSMLSGLNNLSVYTVLDKKYSAYFGFTEKEVNDLLQYYSLTKYSKGIKDWYNGYNIGGAVIYNPWSIMNCVSNTLISGEELVLKNYWAESGTNDLIKETLVGANKDIKEQLQHLSQFGEELANIIVDARVHFDQLAQNSRAFWSLLLATGYLTTTRVGFAQDTEYKCGLRIPNKEVLGIFSSCVDRWLNEQKVKYIEYWNYLVAGNVDGFGRALQEFFVETVGAKDAQTNQKRLENFYHGFMLGLSFGIHSHIVKSNVESGYGFYDLLIKPKVKRPSSLGIILEFKAPEKKEKLDAAAQKGLQQTIAGQYVAELKKEGYTNFLVVGIAFLNKKVSWAWVRGKNPKELEKQFAQRKQRISAK